jgi:hypothetical protein
MMDGSSRPFRRPFDDPAWKARATRRAIEHNRAMARDEQWRRRVAVNTAESWKDPAIAEARLRRHPVMVNGVKYESIRKAFIALGLDPGRSSTVRKRMVREGAAEFGGYRFYTRLP